MATMPTQDQMDRGAARDFAAIIGKAPIAEAATPPMTRDERQKRYLDEPLFGEDWKGHTESPL